MLIFKAFSLKLMASNVHKKSLVENVIIAAYI